MWFLYGNNEVNLSGARFVLMPGSLLELAFPTNPVVISASSPGSISWVYNGLSEEDAVMSYTKPKIFFMAGQWRDHVSFRFWDLVFNMLVHNGSHILSKHSKPYADHGCDMGDSCCDMPWVLTKRPFSTWSYLSTTASITSVVECSHFLQGMCCVHFWFDHPCFESDTILDRKCRHRRATKGEIGSCCHKFRAREQDTFFLANECCDMVQPWSSSSWKWCQFEFLSHQRDVPRLRKILE